MLQVIETARKVEPVNTSENIHLRIQQAVDAHPLSPPGHGQQTWLREHLERAVGLAVSLNTVSKWMTGKAVPRPERISQLAEALHVDPVWLAMGHSAQRTPDEARRAAQLGDAAVAYVVGALSMAQVGFAFPREDDELARWLNVHLYVVRNGSMTRVTCVSGEVEVGARVSFPLPSLRVDNTILGVVQLDPGGFGDAAIFDLTGCEAVTAGPAAFARFQLAKGADGLAQGDSAFPRVRRISELP